MCIFAENTHIMMKICKKCNKQKNAIYFHKDQRTSDGLYRWCKACKKEYDAKYRLEYNSRPEVIEYFSSEAYRQRRMRQYTKNLGRRLYVIAKYRSHDRNLEFDIKPEDIHLPELCPLLNIPLYYEIKKGMNWNAPSLDRIDSSKGYVKGNVWIISRLANTMKSIANTEQLKTFSTNILKLIEDGKSFG